MGTTTSSPDLSRAAALIDRLDPREGETCHVAGCIHSGATPAALAA